MMVCGGWRLYSWAAAKAGIRLPAPAAATAKRLIHLLIMLDSNGALNSCVCKLARQSTAHGLTRVRPSCDGRAMRIQREDSAARSRPKDFGKKLATDHETPG